MLTALKGKGLTFDTVDGYLPEQKEQRDKLFGISGLRGKYPQVFVRTGDEIEFIGDAEAFNELLELDDLPVEVLAANPDIVTFAKRFAACEKTA